mgnify:FL=1
MSTENKDKIKSSVTIIAIVIGWILTFGGLLWNFSGTQANTELRLQMLESEIINLDARLDRSEEFRVSLMADLAEIKTDLLWIRRALENDRN